MKSIYRSLSEITFVTFLMTCKFKNHYMNTLSMPVHEPSQNAQIIFLYSFRSVVFITSIAFHFKKNEQSNKQTRKIRKNNVNITPLYKPHQARWSTRFVNTSKAPTHGKRNTEIYKINNIENVNAINIFACYTIFLSSLLDAIVHVFRTGFIYSLTSWFSHFLGNPPLPHHETFVQKMKL